MRASHVHGSEVPAPAPAIHIRGHVSTSWVVGTSRQHTQGSKFWCVLISTYVWDPVTYTMTPYF